MKISALRERHERNAAIIKSLRHKLRYHTKASRELREQLAQAYETISRLRKP